MIQQIQSVSTVERFGNALALTGVVSSDGGDRLGDTMKSCAVCGCNRPVRRYGFCDAHSQRYKKRGDALPHVPIGEVKGVAHPNWKGHERQRSDGRFVCYAPDHPHARARYVLRYRLVMEKHIGRFLRADEVIHHKNGCASDDRIENLEIMDNSSHMKLHGFNRSGNDEWTKRCPRCKIIKRRSEFYGVSGYCKVCSSAYCAAYHQSHKKV